METIVIAIISGIVWISFLGAIAFYLRSINREMKEANRINAETLKVLRDSLKDPSGF